MPADLIAVSVGNTRTRVGLFRAAVLEESAALPSTDTAALAKAVVDAAARAVHDTPIVIASVNDSAAERLVMALDGESLTGETYRFGRDLIIPIQAALRDEAAARTVGQDRLLNALGAFSRAGQAAIVIDAGTAITVDFVDGAGTFQGGAIAPGLNMMLRALHEHTAALPALALQTNPPAASLQGASPAEPFGKDTREAMLVGVRAAARGMVHELIDRYAEFYGAYPQVIATGGDARALFEGDELIEHIVPDLTLLGIQAACAVQLEGQHDAADDLE